MSQVINTITPPDWLDAAFIQKALSKGLRQQQLLVKNCEIKPATAVGDNYASQMFRARLVLQRTTDSEPEKMSIVMKKLPLGKMADTMHEIKFFDKESLMLVETLPSLNRILKNVFPDHEDFNATCYYIQGAPQDLIVLEDLRESGFTLGDRQNGLDWDHITLVLKNMARLHASSLALAREDTSILDTYSENIWSSKYEHLISKMMTQGMENLAEQVRTWDDLADRDVYVKKLVELQATILPRLYKVHEADKSKLNVLLHGDCWVNNMMFRYNKGKVSGMKFVDYQIPNWNSPLLDFQYFVFTSVQDELRATRIPDMIRIYHGHFMATVQALDVNLPTSFTLQDMTEEYYKTLFFGFVSLTTVYPITTANPQDAPDVNDIIDADSDVRNDQLYKTERLRKVVSRNLPYFVSHNTI